MQLLLEQEGLINLPDDIKRELVYISNDSPRFKDWFQENMAKIKSKYRGAITVDDKKDITAEMICVAEMLKSYNLEDVIYEPFGTEQRAPDFRQSYVDRHCI